MYKYSKYYFNTLHDRIESIDVISTWYQSALNHNSGEEIEFVLNNIQICRYFLWSYKQIKMSFNGLRLEYALEGSSNYIAWKDKMEVVLEDNGLKEFIDNDIPKPMT